MALVPRTDVVNLTTIGGERWPEAKLFLPSYRCKWPCWVVVIVPILIVYPFLQRHFAKGVMIGAVKG